MKLRLAIILIWGCLISLLVARNVFIPELDTDVTTALAKAREESFYGVWFQDKRIGYVENRIREAGKGVFSLDQRAHLRLNILNQTQQIEMHLKANLDKGQRVQDFTFSFRSPFYSMEARGTVEGRTISLVTDTGGTKRKETIVLREAPFISTNHRAYLLNPVPEPGRKTKIPFFDPLSLSGRDTIVEYVGKEKILIKKQIYHLHHFESLFSGVRINFWLDENGKVIKEESPAGFVFLAEPEFKARDIQDGQEDLLRAVAVPYSGHLPPGDTFARIDYRVFVPADVELDLDGGRQQYREGMLRITREKIPTEMDTPAGGEDCGDPKATWPSRYVQSDHPEISAHARTITLKSESTFQKVKHLASWVYENIDKRPVIGLPDALATLHSRMGDCNEHAALFAALARSSGIPTRIVAGVTLHLERFYYHAWNEVCIDGRWISLDTTKNQIPADLTHIRLVSGDLEEQVRIGALLGKLRIEIVQ